MTIRLLDRPLILASASRIRFELLRQSGVTVQPCPVNIDEDALRNTARKCGAEGGEIAIALAHEKARAYSTRQDAQGNAVIIAADQILTCDGRQIDKAPNLPALRKTLLFLRGKTHILQTSCVLYRDGAPLWTYLAKPRLHMRDFDDRFLDAYLQQEGENLLSSVGGYEFEGKGVQLFDAVEGAFHDILGLPLLPLLSALRQFGAIG